MAQRQTYIVECFPYWLRLSWCQRLALCGEEHVARDHPLLELLALPEDRKIDEGLMEVQRVKLFCIRDDLSGTSEKEVAMRCTFLKEHALNSAL